MAKGNKSRHSNGLRALCICAVPALTLLGGCADEIQFQGKVFDAVGLGANSQKKSEEPTLAARAPLVLPPNNDRIPEPGTPTEEAASDTSVAALDDPDKKAVVNKAELEKQQAEYCKVNYEQAKARGDETAADLAVGPLGQCRGSILSAIEKWNKGEDE